MTNCIPNTLSIKILYYTNIYTILYVLREMEIEKK